MADFKIIDPNFANISMESTGLPDTIEVSGETLLVLSWLLGFDNTSKKWSPLQVDSDGRMLVSLSASPVSSVIQSKVATSTVNAVALIANSDRKQMIIQNVGTEDVYLGLSDDPATTDDMLLVAGAIYIEDIYFGEVNVIMASGVSELRIAEFS